MRAWAVARVRADVEDAPLTAKSSRQLRFSVSSAVPFMIRRNDPRPGLAAASTAHSIIYARPSHGTARATSKPAARHVHTSTGTIGRVLKIKHVW